jgi:hypothetical protein
LHLSKHLFYKESELYIWFLVFDGDAMRSVGWALVSIVLLVGCNAQDTVELADGSRIITLARLTGNWREKNRLALAIYAQRGDDCSKPRLIRHFVPGKLADLQRMKSSLPISTRVAVQENPPNLIFLSFGSCSVESLTRRGVEIDRIARRFGVAYDGWDVDYAPR